MFEEGVKHPLLLLSVTLKIIQLLIINNINNV